MRYTTKEIALVAILSCLGAVISVPIGYLGNYLKTISIIPFGFGQILSGFHLFILTLSSLLIRKPEASTVTATIKGLVEAILFSFHGIPVIIMSALQGLILDIIINILGKRDLAYYIGCGIASTSNVAYIQFFLLSPFPTNVFVFMYLLAFFSGLIFGGYGGVLLYKMVKIRM